MALRKLTIFKTTNSSYSSSANKLLTPQTIHSDVSHSAECHSPQCLGTIVLNEPRVDPTKGIWIFFSNYTADLFQKEVQLKLLKNFTESKRKHKNFQ